MSGKVILFTELKEKTGEPITLCDNVKCNILGVRKVGSDLLIP